MQDPIAAERGMTDAQMLDRLDRAVFVPASPEDLIPYRIEELASMTTEQAAALAVGAHEIEPYART